VTGFHVASVHSIALRSATASPYFDDASHEASLPLRVCAASVAGRHPFWAGWTRRPFPTAALDSAVGIGPTSRQFLLGIDEPTLALIVVCVAG
jgi:hypothetical protein